MKNWDGCTSISRLENYFQRAGGGHKMFGYTSENYYFDLHNEQDYLKAYNACPPLKAIIGKRAKAFNTGKIELINKNTGNYAKGSEANRIKAIFANPNVLQTEAQFRAQQNIYVDLFGYCPVLVVKPVGMPDEVSSLWNIPPWLFDLDYTKKWLKQQKVEDIYKKFWIYWNEEKVELDFDSVYFIMDDGIGTDDDANLTIPDSRLISLEYPVSNTIASYKSRNTLITKRGAIGILSNAGRDQSGIIPLKKGEKEIVQNEFKQYGIVGQPYQVIVTDAALQWQQMGFPTKDLMLFEEVQDNIERMCDQYGYPFDLLSKQKGTTFANRNEAKKELYQDTIIPEAESRLQGLSRAILPKDSSFTLHIDFSHVEALQEDKKANAESRRALDMALKLEYDSGLITKNDWREAIGLDRLPDAKFDAYKEETTNDLTKEDAGATPENQGA
jgi:hypothetical protein